MSLTWGPHPWAQELYLSSAPSIWSLTELCWRSAALLYSCSHASAWLWSSLRWMSTYGLASLLDFCHYGPAWWSLDLILFLTYWLPSWFDLRPTSLPLYCILTWTFGWTWPLPLGLPCSPLVLWDWDLAGKAPPWLLAHLPSRISPALAAPWQIYPDVWMSGAPQGAAALPDGARKQYSKSEREGELSSQK